MDVDAASLITEALATGAAAAAKDTASAAIKDVYGGLRTLVKKRFGGQERVETALTLVEAQPDRETTELRAALIDAGAVDDLAVIEAARQLLAAISAEDGGGAAKYRVDLRHSQGVTVGDGNVQHNSFGHA